MDRQLDPQIRRRQIVKRSAFGVLAVAFLWLLLGWAPRWISPSVNRADIRTALVDSGPIEATISASGTVEPESEQVLSSPFDARIIKILKKSGAVLKRGEPILDLDISESQLSLEQLKEKLALKENAREQSKLELENKLIDLRRQLSLKRIDVKSLGIQVEKQQRLRDHGLNSEEQLRQAMVDEEKARIEVKQLEESISNVGRSTETKLQGLALEMATLQKEKEQSQRQLELATTKADRDGVLTWVVAEEGAIVRKNDVVARIADLNSFRVRATVSDIHAARLSRGLPVKVKVNDTDYLNGRVSDVLPTIKDGIATVLVALEDKSNKLLRSNLRVDVFLIADHKQRVLRVKRGAFANGEGLQDVFVVRGGKVIKTPVRLGIFSFDHCEVVSGLLEGDEVVLSDMKDYAHLKEVRLL